VFPKKAASKNLDLAYDIAYTYHVHLRQQEKLMNTLSASEARANLYRLMDETASSHMPVLISGKRNNAVLVAEEDWSAIQETLYLLSVPGMRESIKTGMSEPLDKSAKALKW
jgi:prevent-host-death family protein